MTRGDSELNMMRPENLFVMYGSLLKRWHQVTCEWVCLAAPNCVLKHELLCVNGCFQSFLISIVLSIAFLKKVMGCAFHALQELRIDTLRGLIGGVEGFWLYTICTVCTVYTEIYGV